MSVVELSPQAVELEHERAVKRLGLIALATDLTSERDFIRILPVDKVGIHVARVAFENPTTPENLRKMMPRLTAAADLLVPDIPLDAICYSCTAASVVIGDDEVAAAIHAVRPGVPVVTPAGAARMAMRALSIKHLSILAPYLVETSTPMADYFGLHGLDVLKFECLGLADDRKIARVSPDTIIKAALSADDPRSDGLFISCTALQTLGVIDEIENHIGKPVITSNQASIWAMMHRAGLHEIVEGCGRLFSRDICEDSQGGVK